MREVTLERMTVALENLGIQSGDSLLVHSAVQFLGRPVGGVGMYYDAVCTAAGIRRLPTEIRDQKPETGTLAVPTFNFGFARGEPYDPAETPSQRMGVFSEYVRCQPDARRTPHPMQSLAVVGYYAEDLASRDTLCAFDPGSAFERLLELDAKLLLLGATIQACSIAHYSEQRAAVPYRFWKDFRGKRRTPSGWETCLYRMFARDLDVDPRLTLHPVQSLLQSRNQWGEVAVNYGKIASCRLVDFVSAADELLAADPWALVGNRFDAWARFTEKQASLRP